MSIVHRGLRIVQLVLGIYFLAMGVTHFVLPPGLPPLMSWLYDLSPTLHLASGTAEILGGLGLIVAGVTRIRMWPTPLAAGGLALVMVFAIGFHLTRGETGMLPLNALLGGLAAFVAYGRWRLRPLA